MDKEKVNPNFDISAKCKDMITTSEMIVDRYQSIIDRGYEPSIYASLAYDVKNCLPKLLKENHRLKSEIENLKEFKEEHDIMKHFIIENNLWESFLNYDEFIEWLEK